MVHSGTFQVQRTADEVFDLLANPERFAPLMPDFESVTMQDATHFTLRTVIQVGAMSGHANLAMELRDAVRPGSVGYSGDAIIAGSRLRLRLDFVLTPGESATEIGWRGELTLGGSLAFMAGGQVESISRQNFERMAERLQESLRQEQVPSPEEAPGSPLPEALDFEI
jgi:carbon monoxide dehydrogenase subunit G